MKFNILKHCEDFKAVENGFYQPYIFGEKALKHFNEKDRHVLFRVSDEQEIRPRHMNYVDHGRIAKVIARSHNSNIQLWWESSHSFNSSGIRGLPSHSTNPSNLQLATKKGFGYETKTLFETGHLSEKRLLNEIYRADFVNSVHNVDRNYDENAGKTVNEVISRAFNIHDFSKFFLKGHTVVFKQFFDTTFY